MIVKNEAARIERCLDSVKPYIACWSILDTGSDDDTCERITRTLAAIPGHIGKASFIDFGTTRNVALDDARKMECEYLLLVDADHELKVEKPLVLSYLKAEAYSLIHVKNESKLQFPNVRLVRRDSKIKYVGATHEYLNANPSDHITLQDGIWLLDHGDSNRIDKYTRDLALLTAENKRDRGNPRTIFYLAQTYMGLNDVNNAILFYEKRAALGGFSEEIYVALLTLARIKMRLGYNFSDVYKTFHRAIQTNPARAEAWHGAAELARAAMCYHEAYELARCGLNLLPPADGLFVEPWIYHWGMLDEYVVDAYWSGHLSEAGLAVRSLLQCPDLDAKSRKRIEKNAELIRKGLTEQIFKGVGNGRSS